MDSFSATSDANFNLALHHRSRALRRLKAFIWAYIILLILEGSVRKWIPPLSLPFLVIRDPVALLIWIWGARLHLGNRVAWGLFYIYAAVITVLLSLQIVVSGLNPLIGIFGWRSYVLHVPVIIVIAAYLKEKDLLALAKCLLYISIPMTVLMVLQYISPSEAFINAGAGEGGAQLNGALNHIRPAGTFSFVSGPIQFVPLVTAFILWALTRKDYFPRWLVLSSAVATIIAIPVSISRSVAIYVGATLAVVALGLAVRSGIAFNPKRLPQMALGAVIALAILAGISQVALVQDAVNTFTTRWTQAQDKNGESTEMFERIQGVVTYVAIPMAEAPLLGVGLGAGSLVATALENKANSQGFEFGEVPTEREVFELGPLIGIGFLLSRAMLALVLLVGAFKALKQGFLLPLFLLTLPVIDLASAGVDQTTQQGFMTLTIALAFAAIAMRNEKAQAFA